MLPDLSPRTTGREWSGSSPASISSKRSCNSPWNAPSAKAGSTSSTRCPSRRADRLASTLLGAVLSLVLRLLLVFWALALISCCPAVLPCCRFFPAAGKVPVRITGMLRSWPARSQISSSLRLERAEAPARTAGSTSGSRRGWSWLPRSGPPRLLVLLVVFLTGRRSSFPREQVARLRPRRAALRRHDRRAPARRPRHGSQLAAPRPQHRGSWRPCSCPVLPSPLGWLRARWALRSAASSAAHSDRRAHRVARRSSSAHPSKLVIGSDLHPAAAEAEHRRNTRPVPEPGPKSLGNRCTAGHRGLQEIRRVPAAQSCAQPSPIPRRDP